MLTVVAQLGLNIFFLSWYLWIQRFIWHISRKFGCNPCGNKKKWCEKMWQGWKNDRKCSILLPRYFQPHPRALFKIKLKNQFSTDFQSVCWKISRNYKATKKLFIHCENIAAYLKLSKINNVSIFLDFVTSLFGGRQLQPTVIMRNRSGFQILYSQLPKKGIELW